LYSLDYSTFSVSDNPQTEDQQLGCLWQGDELISVSLSGDIIYHDPNNPKKPKKVVKGHNKNITALAYDAANKHMYSGSYDANIGIHCLLTISLLHNLRKILEL
jgi:hypothetical protein